MKALAKVQAALREAGSENKSSDDWNCVGPNHRRGFDKKASLTVKYGDEPGKVIVACGLCETEDILEALGLSMRDLNDDEEAAPVSTFYVYRNEAGKPLSRVERQDPDKTFLQSRPDASRPSGWRYGVKNVRKVLFQLPELREALDGTRKRRKVVHVVEGEKNVLYLQDKGYVATTKSEGAGSPWLDSYTETLRGAKEIIVWADRDAPGYRNAHVTVSALLAAGLNARAVLPLTEARCDDVIDHLEAGHGIEDGKPVTLNELIELADADTGDDEDPAFARELSKARVRARVRTTLREEEADSAFLEPESDWSLKESLDKPREDLPYTIDRLHVTGQTAVVAAEKKVGKTVLMMNLAKSYADGTKFLGEFAVMPGAGRIAYLNYELSEDVFLAYVEHLEIENPDRICVLNLRGRSFDLRSPSAMAWLVKWARDRGCDASIVDPANMAARLKNENDNSEALRWYTDCLERFKNEAGIRDLWMPAHASGRGQGEEGDEHPRGATSIEGVADVNWTYTKQKIEGDDGKVLFPRYLSALGRRVEVSEREVHFDSAEGSLYVAKYRSRAKARAQSSASQVKRIVKENPGINATDLKEKLTVGNRDKGRVVSEAERAGLVHHVPGPHGSKLYHPGKRVEP